MANARKDNHRETESDLAMNLPLSRAALVGESSNGEIFAHNSEVADDHITGATSIDCAEDRLRGGYSLCSDITEDKKTKAEIEQAISELRDQTQFLKTLCDTIDDGIIVSDLQGKISFVNSTTERIFGKWIADSDMDEWSKTHEVFYPDIKTPVPIGQLLITHALMGEETDEIELFVRNKENSEGTYISARGRPIRSRETNEVIAGLVVFRDITQFKQIEAELKQTITELQYQNELAETMFNSISDGIVVFDLSGRSAYINPSAKQITGIDEMASPLTNWAKKHGIFYSDQKTLIRSRDLPLFRIISRGETIEEQDIFIRNENKPDGVYIRMSGRPLLNEAGKIRGGVFSFHDVTEQMIAEEALARAFAQGRVEIVDTILHNIGNAINSVITGIETVHQNLVDKTLTRRLCALANAVKAHRDDWIDYTQNDPQGQQVIPFIIALAEDFSRQDVALVKTVDRVRDRVRHIEAIIRTQRALSNSNMDRKDIDLRHTLSNVVKVLQESLKKRAITTVIDCENAPQEIRIQESQFHQMMVNLIKNSIEAIDDLDAAGGLNAPPRIHIRAYTKGDFLNLDVSDNGIGIDLKNTKRIFAAGYTTKESGSGLGLHSVANFVISSGGQIRPLSDGIGKGATMRIRLRCSSIISPLGEEY